MTNEKEIRSYLEDEYMSLSEKVNALVIVFKQARKEAIEECIKEFEGTVVQHEIRKKLEKLQEKE